jgi:hypothetical protein
VAGGDTTAPGAGVSDAAAHSGGGRVPDFFIVGHPKCGTTALYLMLRGHPQIFMPANKEPRYFSTDLRSRFAARQKTVNPVHTLDGYMSLFAPAGPHQRAGEASPIYLISRAAAAGIAELQPDARIVAILREPASFLRSFHLQMVSSGVETEKDLAKAIALEDSRREGERIPSRTHNPQMLLYSEHVRYVDQLRRFHDVFAPENVLVLIYEDFRDDNEATLRRVLRFLDVDETVPLEAVETNHVKAVRSVRLHHLTAALHLADKRPAAAGPLSRAANALIPKRLRSSAARDAWRRLVYSQPPAPDPAYMLELRRRFTPEVLALSAYLDRDLVGRWGYDEVG